MKSIVTLLFFGLWTAFGSCMIAPPPDPSLKSSIIDCSETRTWNAERLNQAISGTWRLYKQYENGTGHENVALHFGTDGLLTITRVNRLVSQAPFSIRSVTGTEFYIETSGEGKVYVDGRLYLCEEHMLLSPLPAGGAEFYYQRD